MGIVPNTEFTVSFSKYPSIKAKKTINYTKITSLIEVIFCFIRKLNIASQRMASAGDVSKKNIKAKL